MPGVAEMAVAQLTSIPSRFESEVVPVESLAGLANLFSRLREAMPSAPDVSGGGACSLWTDARAWAATVPIEWAAVAPIVAEGLVAGRQQLSDLRSRAAEAREQLLREWSALLEAAVLQMPSSSEMAERALQLSQTLRAAVEAIVEERPPDGARAEGNGTAGASQGVRHDLTRRIDALVNETRRFIFAAAPVLRRFDRPVDGGRDKSQQRRSDGQLAAPPDCVADGAAVPRWPLYVFVGSALVCLSASVVYHLFGTANERWLYYLSMWDYTGITCLVVGSTIPVIHCETRLLSPFLPPPAPATLPPVLPSLALPAARRPGRIAPPALASPRHAPPARPPRHRRLLHVLCAPRGLRVTPRRRRGRRHELHADGEPEGVSNLPAPSGFAPRQAADGSDAGGQAPAKQVLPAAAARSRPQSFFYSELWRLTRVSSFVGLGVFGAVPLTHLLFFHDFDPVAVRLYQSVALMGAVYGMGVLVYATRFPEAVAPRRFDIFGASHQLWHVFVLLAAYVHHEGLVALWRSTSISNSLSCAALPLG